MKSFISILILLIPNLVVGQVASEQSYFTVSETVELALIIAAVSELDRDSNNSIDRTSEYYDSVENHFQSYEKHPLFKELGDSFNLPRLVGNAADFEFDENDSLVMIDSSGSIWGDDAGNLFIKHLSLIQNFARKSAFREFFKANQDVYSEIVKSSSEVADQKNSKIWLENLFEPQEAIGRIFISPLMSGFHWTTLFKPEQRIWISPADPNIIDTEDILTRLQYTRILFTELDHSYVNPVTSRYEDELNKAIKDLKFWATGNGYTFYPSNELMFNEYMTWALFIVYADNYLDGEEMETLETEVVEFMEEGRGFINFGSFTAELKNQHSLNNSDGDILIRQMINWCSKQES